MQIRRGYGRASGGYRGRGPRDHWGRPAQHEEEFNRWYNEEHIPEQLAIPGVLNAAQYQAVEGGPKYLACYELASPEA